MSRSTESHAPASLQGGDLAAAMYRLAAIASDGKAAFSDPTIAAGRLALYRNLWQPSDALPRAHADSPGMLSLARFILAGKTEAGIGAESKTYDIARASIAQVVMDAANRIRRAECCLAAFVTYPLDARNGAVQTLMGNPRDFGKIMMGVSAPACLWWRLWMEQSFAPSELASDLSVIRDWIDAFMPLHAQRFECRALDPWVSHGKLIQSKLDSRTPWPEAQEHARSLRFVADYLGMLCKAVAHSDAAGWVDRLAPDAPTDPWGTPPRLLRVAHELRSHGQVMTTAELRRRGFDMGKLLAASKGCDRGTIEWADKHLRAGKGEWQWSPCSLPSRK